MNCVHLLLFIQPNKQNGSGGYKGKLQEGGRMNNKMKDRNVPHPPPNNKKMEGYFFFLLDCNKHIHQQ
jgi:hypothetical protein